MRYIIPPASSGTAPGSPPCWSYLENLQRGTPRGHPDQISEPPQLSPLEVKEQRLYSELPQSWVKLSFGGNSFPSLVHKTLNLKLLCLGRGFMAQPRGDNLWFSGREPWTQHLQILTNHLAANLLDAWWRTQTKEASRNMSSTKSRDANLRLLNGTLSWTSCPWISQTEIKKDNISCAFDIFIFVLWYQKRYGVFFYAGIVWKLRILLLWQPYLRLNFISWWDSVNPFSRQSSSAPVNLCDAGPQPVTQPPLGPLTFLGLSFSQLPLFSRCSVQKNWRQPWRCHCSAWVVATTTTWWESCELSSKSSVMLGFMTIVPRGRKEGSRQP